MSRIILITRSMTSFSQNDNIIYDINSLRPNQDIHFDIDVIDISSTEIRFMDPVWEQNRKRLEEGLAPEVLEYIEKHSLYGFKVVRNSYFTSFIIIVLCDGNEIVHQEYHPCLYLLLYIYYVNYINIIILCFFFLSCICQSIYFREMPCVEYANFCLRRTDTTCIYFDHNLK